MLGSTSNRCGAPTPDARGWRPRTLLRELRLPSILLALAVVGLHANFAGPQTANAASVPESLPAAIYASAPAAAPAIFSQNAQGLSPKVLAMALDAVSSARARGVSGRSDRLTVIDYSLPSTTPRLWVLDLAQGKVLFHELVAHGAGSGDLYATHFSNVNESRQSSLGLFLTGDTYEGGKGYSLKLRGLDAGLNDLAEKRNIVMHGAWYVSADHARQFGMIGRSWGCPALPVEDVKPVIDTIKGGTFVYSYAGSGSAPAQPAVARASYSPASVHLHRRPAASTRMTRVARATNRTRTSSSGRSATSPSAQPAASRARR
ncbi:MAG TPA: murein L,D-transpeptidase catalytic domain family protein [Thermoanaerobaculia bacterium]|jgi:hypothetical protein